ncbi:hypothetical protein JHD48_05510 [Sulfurimonas sp. SAG-AH-194-I05]|nr:hypothetical protein [Sulfurimonas sp. SAG-AH-194-I05]MDF1875183.1 hypothetical protein [Sulfurimonas sp. SAG-AH-194-I05]
MSKVVQAFLTGVFFTFFLDFFLFLGIKLHYIDFYEIDVYYNSLFADHQNIYIYTFFTILFGFLITYVEHVKTNIILIGGLFFLALSTLIAPVGFQIGHFILSQKNVTFEDDRYTYIGDIYYDGREKITFYDYEVKKIILINKKDLK